MPERHSAAKLAHFKSKCQKLSAENRYLKQRLKELSSSRALHKDKCKTLQSSNTALRGLLFRVQGAGDTIADTSTAVRL